MKYIKLGFIFVLTAYSPVMFCNWLWVAFHIHALLTILTVYIAYAISFVLLWRWLK